MAIYINGYKKIKNIFANVKGEKKTIVSAWANKDGVPAKVFSLDREVVDPIEIAPTNEINNWQYELDDENNIITLQRYINTSATDVVVYANYAANGKTYKTQLECFEMFRDRGNIKTVKFSDDLDTTNVTDMSRMFSMSTYGTESKLIRIDFGKNFNTSNVTDMSWMFSTCESLEELDVSSFSTGNVTNMDSMFSNCYNLKNLNVCNFDTRNVANMKSMFFRCESLTELDLSNFDTSKVTNMDGMFGKNPLLAEINLSSFDTSKVTSMNNMFLQCTSLAALDLGSFNTSNVTHMESMFEQCSSLTALDLSNFDTRNVTNMKSMFRNASNLKTIYATNGIWSTVKADSTATYMFYGCGTSSVTYK